MFKMSEQIGELAVALAKAQDELKPAPMNCVNKFLGNKYADLGAVIETAKPVLLKNNLSISQLVGSEDDKVSVTTILMHSSGQWLSDTASIAMGDEKGKSAAQVAGSLITYLRRYSYAAILGMYADEDTDGNSAPGNGRHQAAPQSQPKPLTAKVDVRSFAAKQTSQPELSSDTDEQGSGAAPASHWSADPRVRKAFWTETAELGFTNDVVHKTLGVTHLADFEGTREQAMALLTQRMRETSRG